MTPGGAGSQWRREELGVSGAGRSWESVAALGGASSGAGRPVRAPATACRQSAPDCRRSPQTEEYRRAGPGRADRRLRAAARCRAPPDRRPFVSRCRLTGGGRDRQFRGSGGHRIVSGGRHSVLAGMPARNARSRLTALPVGNAAAAASERQQRSRRSQLWARCIVTATRDLIQNYQRHGAGWIDTSVLFVF